MRQRRRSVIRDTDEGGAMDREKVFQYKTRRIKEGTDVCSETAIEGALGE